MLQGAKYRWRVPSEDLCQRAQALFGAYQLSMPVLQVLVNRGYTTPEQLEEFLFTPARSCAFSAKLLKGAEQAVARVMQALKNQEKILIAGDYDVDGMTATSLLLACLGPLDARVNFFLPHRVRDGYGLSEKTVQRAAANGYTLLITVDNGITAFDAVMAAQKLGIDVIVTDHHKPHGEMPIAHAIVNPMQLGCEYPCKLLAGVGVAFKLASLLYETLGKELPEKVYELLLLGTVADVVPLLSENRYMVRYGLQQVQAHESMAIKVLKENAKLSRAITSTDIGFFLAPQLNALGRLDDPRDGVKFLIGDDDHEIQRIGLVLHELNQARKSVEKHVVDDVVADIKQGVIDLKRDMAIIASRPSWPPGVIGLAASRLVSAYGRPAFLFHESRDGLVKGSCRSIAGLSLFDALESMQELLVNFGGHAAAAGLSLKRENFDAFKQRMNDYIAATVAPEDLQQTLVCDALLTLPDAKKKLMSDLAYLEPFGNGNAAPVFLVRNVSLIEQPTLLKEVHVKCMIFADGIIKPVIFFNRPDLYDVLKNVGDASVNVAVQVVENFWNDTARIEFHGLDVAVGA
jgi:single-stranded-DNA-specific exonuclease